MEEILSTNTVGLGLIIALMMLHLVLPYVRPPAKNGSAGEQSIEFWRQTNKIIATETLTTSIVPILAKQTEILTELRALQTADHEMALRHDFTAQQAAASLEKLRTSNHAIVNRLQRAPATCPFGGAGEPVGQ